MGFEISLESAEAGERKERKEKIKKEYWPPPKHLPSEGAFVKTDDKRQGES
jgi:hypothetical protein